MRESFHAVPVRAGLSSHDFFHAHVLARQPVLIQGALTRWNALRWNPQYLKARVGRRQIRYRTEGEPATVVFGDIVDRIFDGGGARAPYLRNIDLAEQLPELVDDIRPEPVYGSQNWRSHPLMPARWPPAVKKNAYELFISPAAAAFPYLHIDYWGMSTFLAQISGEKEVILFPPEDAPNLYPTAGDPLVSEITDFDALDDARYPKLRAAKQHRVTLRAGDLLYNPGWWHTTKTTQTAITVIWGYWNRHEWAHMVAAVHARGRIRGRLLAQYVRFVGMCNHFEALSARPVRQSA